MRRMEPIVPFEPVRAADIPAGPDWIHQIKWDGVRILAYYDGGPLRLFNRKKRERTAQYPELTSPSYCKASSFILDGEVIALAADGKPSFHEVMRRDGIRTLSRVPQAVQSVPIAYMVFDILYCDGEWTIDRPLSERQRLLEERLVPSRAVQPVASHPDGAALFDVIRSHGMEGIVSKKTDSAYATGGKDTRWVKVKNYGDVVAVIGGFRMEEGVVRAVLAGLYREGRLLFIGKVGTGKLSAADWRELTERLTAIETPVCPFAGRHEEFRGARWVKPLLTAKIRYSEWRLHEGRTMRQPSIQAFVDKPPEECVFE